MKKVMISLMLGLLIMPAVIWAQDSPTDKLYEKYSGKDGFTTVHICKDLFIMVSEMQDENKPQDKETKEVLNNLEFIRILIFEDGDKHSKEFKKFKEELQELKLNGYKELMMVKENDEEVKFLIRRNGEKMEELLLLIDQDDEAGFISIFGNIDLKSISNLSKTMNIEGLDKLEELEELEDK